MKAKQNCNRKKVNNVGGAAEYRGSVRASHPAAPSSIISVSKKISQKTLIQCYQVVLSGQRLDNIKRTHIVLASGTLVLQKVKMSIGKKNTKVLVFYPTSAVFGFFKKIRNNN